MGLFDVFGDIASSLPIVGSFFNSSSENSMEDEYKKNQGLWQKLLEGYQGPESDPAYREQLAGLNNQANGGLNPADRAAMLEAYSQAQQMARGREGAIGQQMQMRGGGVASSGQQAALQAQAGQQAAQRYQSTGMQQAGVASDRAQRARLAYLDTVERNRQNLNQYRMAATGGMTGANTQVGNMYGARDASRKASMQHWLDTGVNMAMGKGAAPPSTQYQGGAQPYGADSYLSNGEGYGGYYGT